MKVIIEIPIYYIDKNQLNEKWKTKREKFEQHLIRTGTSKKDAHDSFLRCFKIESTWDFNKIIGYIRILYDAKTGDLKFLIFKSTKKKFYYNKKFIMSFEKLSGPNLHVFVRDKNNKEIKTLMKDKIKYITETFFKINNFVDLSSFENLYKYYDFEKFINNSRK